MFRVAIAGNPNSGKTSLFNALTGQNQYVGNWPGVTVEKKQGYFVYNGEKIEITDLPGTYSLTPYSIDERIARDYILKDRPDIVVIVADSINLERNFYLLLEVLHIHRNVVLVLNMSDIAQKNGINVRQIELFKILGIPVVQTVANKGIGVEKLKEAIHSNFKKQNILYVENLINKIYSNEVSKRINALSSIVKKYVEDYPPDYIAVKLLERDDEMREKIISKNNGKVILQEADRLIREIEEYKRDDTPSVLAMERYAFIHGVYKEVVEIAETVEKKIDATDKIDRVMTNRYLGIPIFLLLMYTVFTLVFKLGGPLSDLLDSGMSKLAILSEKALLSIGLSKYIVSFFSDGIIAGVGSVLVFLPSIMILYLLLAMLEDSGYMARAAFVVDKIMHKFGLHGKSAIPMVISFGCNIPGILATRTLKSEKDRLLTILVIPMIPCAARLPIFILFGSVFFKNHSALFVFMMYALGLTMAFLSSIIMSKVFFKGESSPLVMELPPYRVPDFSVVWRVTKQRTWMFLKKAGTFIMLTVALVWLLGTLPVGVEYASHKSLIGEFGSLLAPVFRPIGFGFWQATVALIFGFLAKEVVVGTLGTVFKAGENTLSSILPVYFSHLSALSFSVYSLLYVPCVAAVAAIWKETNIKWALVSVFYSMTLAYIVAFIIYSIGGVIL